MWHTTKVMRGNLLRVVAHDAFPLTSDGERSPLPTDFVMGIGGASETLLTLTPQRQVSRALDLGCGSGVQTLFLNAERIIATDIDDRALEAAAHSFHMSGFRQVDDQTWRDGDRLITLLRGSLFEPVENQRFDLIVANPPFIISGDGHVHRDSPFVADGLTRELLQRVVPHLNTNGIAIMLTSWLHLRGEAWQDRVSRWIPEGVGAWVAQREVLNLDEYVQVWGDDAGLSAADRQAWRARLRALDAEAVGFGWVVIEPARSQPESMTSAAVGTQADAPRWLRMEDVSTAARVPSGEEVLAQLAACRHEPTAVEALTTRWNFAEKHWRGDLALDPIGAALLKELRSGHVLESALEAVAERFPVDPADLRVFGLGLTLELARLGYLLPDAIPHGI